MPIKGLVTEDCAIDFWGWVLGRRVQPRFVVLLTENHVPIRIPIDQVRHDVTAAGGSGSTAGSAIGFRGLANIENEDIRTRVVVAALWSDGTHSPFGAVYFERFWPRDPDPRIAAFVSIAVIGRDKRQIGHSLEAACSEYEPCELVVVGSAASTARHAGSKGDIRYVAQEGPDLADDYATAIRTTLGDLLTFVPAGCRLCENALGRASAQLNASPEIAAVIGLGEDHNATPGLYRRAAVRRFRGALSRSNPESGLLAELEARGLVECLKPK
jgi:hypothetical protein